METQLAVSRDGRTWRRHPRPTYLPQGELGRDDVHELFMAQGIVRRGDEIWQYFGGHGGNGIDYHSPWKKTGIAPVWRAVQRLDGFVAAEADYQGGTLVTKPLIYAGSKLSLNVDTAATGFVQVGIQDVDGRFFDAFHVDKCVYVNGDSLNYTIEWLDHGIDVSALEGKPVRLHFRMRCAKLFAFEFK